MARIKRENVSLSDREQKMALKAYKESQARHARTEGGYLQSIDRSLNKDSWGNSPSLLQGSMEEEWSPSAKDYTDPLIQMGADRETQNDFLAPTKLNRSDSATSSWDDFTQGASDMYDKSKDYLSGATAEKEGAEAAYNWQDPNKKEEISNPIFQAAAQEREGELEQWGDMAKYDPAPPEASQVAGQAGMGHHPESMMEPQSLLAGQVGTGDHLGIDPSESMSTSDSSEAAESTALTGKQKAMMKMGASLLDSGKDTPAQKAPVGALKMGRVAFPNLLASSKSQANPRYIHKGLG